MGQTKTCIDCDSTFEFTDGERLFFAKNGLSDPKRCPDCRAARKGLEEKQIVCVKCGQNFIYPRDLQLFARSYKWEPPTTCLGGCGTEKYAEDYQFSKFESKASGLLGRYSQYFKGRAPQPTTSSKLSPAKSFSGAKLLGINKNPVISNSDIQEFLDNKIPLEHLGNVRKIIFSNEVKMSQFGPSRGFFDEDSNIIMVNNHPLKTDTPQLYKESLAHECGHAAYSLMAERLQDDWIHQSIVAGPISGRMVDLWYDETRRHKENFAEAYRLYVMSPNDLLENSLEFFEAYQFLCDEVFSGKEYL